MRLFWILAGLTLAASVLAQEPVPLDDGSMAQERSRIATQRQQAEAEFQGKEQACADRFAVEACLKDVRRQRIATMADLKRRDTALNDVQRKQRAAEQLQSIANKATEHARRAEEARQTALQKPGDERAKAQAEKQLQHSANGAAAQRRELAPVKPAQELDENTRAQNSASYAQRLKAAQDRQREREKRLQEKGAPAVSLPRTP